MTISVAHLRSQRGATLIEVIAALGIGALVVAVIALAHYALTSETARQGRRQQTAERIDETLFELREDLQQLFLPAGDPETGIELENSDTNLIRLSFCRWEISADRPRLATNRLERVTYRFSDDPAPDLLRIRRALTGPAAIDGDTTNRLVGTWPRLLVHLHDGDTWQTNWAPAKADNMDPPRPRAARLWLLNEQGDAVAESLVIIPSGLSVTSTLLRAGSTLR